MASRQCIQCGGDVPGPSLWGLCPKCLYAASLEPETEAEPQSPRLVGKYQLEEVLGRGGMGVVYKATQKTPHRTVALKMILEAELATEPLRRRFTLEAELAAKLDHPNIIPIYDVGESEGQSYISMKLVHGETLRKKIDAGEFHCASKTGTPFRERALGCVRLIITVARAVQHAHERGVLHRDLKPGNIIVDSLGQPHLTDFGLAKLMRPDESGIASESVSLPGGALGTPSYMSPEQARGRRVTEASDIYSLGAILYEMLTGRPPFRAATALETLRQVLEEQPKMPRSVNPLVDKDLNTICTKCLEKNPAARYLSAAAVAEDLERWLNHEPIAARPVGPGARAIRWVARNRLGTSLIVTLCLGLLLTTFLLEQALARQRKLDSHRANNILAMSVEMEELWKDPEKRYVLIPSSVLAELADLPTRPPDALTTRLSFAQAINHEPFGQATQYAPFLHRLENRIVERLGRPVVIDLRLYKTEREAVRDLVRGKLAIQRVHPVLYLLANSQSNHLAAVARELGEKQAVIFARKDSGLTNLSQVKGHRVLFGLTDSAVTFCAKVQLARAGILARDLGSCEYLDEEDGHPNLEAHRDPHTQANKRVIRAVAEGQADVGAAPRRQFELARYRKPGLVELHAFQVHPDIYVTSLQLESDIRAAIQESLTSFQSPEDKELLSRLSENAVIKGFEAVQEQNFEEIKTALAREIAAFDGNKSE